MKYHAAVRLTVSFAVAYYVHPTFTLSFVSRQGECRVIGTKNTRLRILTCNNVQNRLHVIRQTICAAETTSLLQTIVSHSWRTGLPGRSAGQRGKASAMSSKVLDAATARVLRGITEKTRIKDMALLVQIVNWIRSHSLYGTCYHDLSRSVIITKLSRQGGNTFHFGIIWLHWHMSVHSCIFRCFGSERSHKHPYISFKVDTHIHLSLSSIGLCTGLHNPT